MKNTLAVTKLNLRNAWLTWLITALCFGSQIISQGIQSFIGPMAPDADLVAVMGKEAAMEFAGFQIGMGSYFYLIVILLAVFVPALHFRKFMNLGVQKPLYLRGTAITYIAASLLVSALNLVSYYTFDKIALLGNGGLKVLNIVDIFGWMGNGLLVAFIRQFAFLLLVAALAHTITTLQTFAYGLVIDAVIIAILAVFIPIAPLRNLLVGFFNFLLFNPNAVVQISVCLVTAVVLYLLCIPAVRRKPV